MAFTGFGGIVGNMLVQLAYGLLMLVIVGILVFLIVIVVKNKKLWNEYYCVLKEIRQSGGVTYDFSGAGVFINNKSGMRLFRTKKWGWSASLTSPDGKSMAVPFDTDIKGRKVVELLKFNDQITFLRNNITKDVIEQSVTEADMNSGVDLIRRRQELFKKMDWKKIAEMLFAIVLVICTVVLLVQNYGTAAKIAEKNADISNNLAIVTSNLNTLVNTTQRFSDSVNYYAEIRQGTTLVGNDQVVVG